MYLECDGHPLVLNNAHVPFQRSLYAPDLASVTRSSPELLNGLHLRLESSCSGLAYLVNNLRDSRTRSTLANMSSIKLP